MLAKDAWRSGHDTPPALGDVPGNARQVPCIELIGSTYWRKRMESQKKTAVEAMREHHQNGQIKVFTSVIFDIIKFDFTVTAASFDEQRIDSEVRVRSKYDIPRRKRSFVVKFDGILGEASAFDEAWFNRYRDFGGMQAYRTVYLDEDKFEVVRNDDWSFSEKVIDARIQKMHKKGIKVGKEFILVKFDAAFVREPSTSVPA